MAMLIIKKLAIALFMVSMLSGLVYFKVVNAQTDDNDEGAPTLKEILEMVKAYNESVDKDLQITINFSHPEYPIVIPYDALITQKQTSSFESAEDIEAFVEDTHKEQSDINSEGMEEYLDYAKDKDNGFGYEEDKDYSNVGNKDKDKAEEDDDDGGEWTQEKFDKKYEDSLPDDGTLDHE